MGFCPHCINPQVYRCVVAFDQRAKERRELEEQLQKATNEIGTAQGQAQLLQRRLPSEAEDFR
eukprot:3080027-Prorocentrum_lima.AAC.1